MKNTIGIDLARKILHIVQVDSTGKKIHQKKVKNDELLPSLSTLKPSLVAMEACAGCHYWAQQIAKMGFKVKLFKTKDVKAYASSRQKNDYNDALAITKASMDPELKSVTPKDKYEQDISFIHKMRMNTIKERIKKTNSLMSNLYEYGFLTKFSKSRFCKECSEELDKAYEGGHISDQVYAILQEECKEIKLLNEKEKLLDKAIVESNKKNTISLKLQQILGIGNINASCLSVASMKAYATPRDFAASLGLVPKQYTSGDKIALGGITKQGSRYARTMLVQAGRTIAICAMKNKNPQDKLVVWAKKKLSENKPFNLVAVGVANKLARIAYSVVVNNTEYDSNLGINES